LLIKNSQERKITMEIHKHKEERSKQQTEKAFLTQKEFCC
jgi:hypothetical protein